MQDIHPITIARAVKANLGELNPNEISSDEKTQINKIRSAHEFVEQANISANSIFSKVYGLAKADNDKKKMDDLKELSRLYGKMVGLEDGKPKNPEKYFNPKIHADALQVLMGALEEIYKKESPRTWVPLEEFQTKKTAETFGNAAFNTYKQFKDKAPVLVIENPPATHALSKGEDIKNVVQKSREQFVKKAVEEGISEGKAWQEAEKLIGATWDVGHINMLRKYGYSEEEVIKEAEKIAPYLKHVHLSDNFGFEHTELPMGMGNVPLKEIMKRLGEKGFEARKIIEAGNWYRSFGDVPPIQETLEAVGSPVYSMEMAPYWSQSPGLYQGYSQGMEGTWLPQINYETFGSGFSRLPKELGGSAPGTAGSRMSGRPME